MTLSFKIQIGQPTFFVEKIWKSFYKGVAINFNEFVKYSKLLTEEQKNKIDVVHPKVHTIREDSNNRWESGNEIHFVINNRTPKRFQFAPVIPVRSVQEIKIEEVFVSKNTYNYQKRTNPTYCRTLSGKIYQVLIDKKLITLKKVEEISRNDGFDSIEDFFKFFGKNFTGKIIHWTDLQY